MCIHELSLAVMCVLWPPDVQRGMELAGCSSPAGARPHQFQMPSEAADGVREGCRELHSVLSPSIKWPLEKNLLSFSLPSLTSVFP